MKRKIYLISSWRNTIHDAVFETLIKAGHEVYDFKKNGFHWSNVDITWQDWTTSGMRWNLFNSSIIEKHYKAAITALMWCDSVVAIAPFSKNAGMELGFAVGSGKNVHLLLDSSNPELMYSMIENIHINIRELLKGLEQ